MSNNGSIIGHVGHVNVGVVGPQTRYGHESLTVDEVMADKSTGCDLCPNFEIIIDEQTPRVSKDMDYPSVFIKENKLTLLQFKEFANTLDNAIGLAANQVRKIGGRRIMSRFFARRLGPSKKSAFEIVVSPSIVKTYGDVVLEREGCLTWPGKTMDAMRYLKIDVSYWTIDGEFVERLTLGRLDSQVWQHEMDHLNGVEQNVKELKSTFVSPKEKIGRNDKCPCGSGRKYKHCCID